MSGIGSGYDYSVSTFSPDGKVFQTEYAQKAVDNSSTTIGLKCKDGVVLAVEKAITSKLLVEHSDRRIFAAAKHVGLAASGIPADGRQVINRVSDECVNYSGFYGEEIPGHVLGERVGSYMHLFNLYGALRPFGTSLLMATYDSSGPALYQVELSGIVQRFFGTAVGKHRQAAKTEIEKLKLTELTCQQALQELAKMLLSQRDDQKPHEIEMGWICESTGWQFKPVPQELVAQAEASAQALLDESDMDDD